MPDTLAADLIGLSHAVFVLFVVGGQALILAGWALAWEWPRNAAFRMSHLGAIVTVVTIDLAGFVCPLTVWEFSLRGRATEDASFIAYWLDQLLYFSGPGWVFTSAYLAFAGLVVLSYRLYPPKP